ncbi:MAG TPA: nucleoside-diphosphate kinase [Calditrichaeota bacterium]|nr:nucleoside-diphosphate kinase [Calditrichota bacterium]
MEQTLAIIKPDGVANGLVGEIIKRIENEGIKLAAMRLVQLDKRQAEGFYYVHRSKSFFSSLIEYMTSGPCVIMVLSATDAINRWRSLMGPTDPQKAPRGTIRGDMGFNIERNVVHGSDSKQSAVYEINYFFRGTDIV